MISQKKIKCYRPYPPHLKNVTALPCKILNFFIWQKVMFQCSTTLCWNSAHVATTADWYSIHALLWVLQYPNSTVPSSSSLSLEQKSTGSITETCCWRRSCYQRSAASLETRLSSSKTMRQHIVLVTERDSSSVLTCGQPTVLTSTQ